MNPRLRRILFSLAVMIWGAVILYFYASGRIVKYLAPDFRWIALLGGLGLLILGLFNALTAGQAADCGHDHGEGEEHDHESGDLHPITALLLMVLPVGLSVMWTKDYYSAGALTRKGAFDDPQELRSRMIAPRTAVLTREKIEASHRKTPDGYLEFSLIELFLSTGDREIQSLIEGMQVETEGRWIEEKTNNAAGTRKRLYRLFMTCCAADSQAIPIILEFGKEPPEFPVNDWVKVAGTMTFPLENGGLQPVLKVDRALAAEPPYEESFLRK